MAAARKGEKGVKARVGGGAGRIKRRGRRWCGGGIVEAPRRREYLGGVEEEVLDEAREEAPFSTML